MTKAYRKIFAYAVVLAVLFVALAAMPKEWHVKSGMTGAEYDYAWQRANNSLAKAGSEAEKRAAATVVRGLYNYKTEGRIDEVKNMGWMLDATRFVLLVAILALCYITLNLVMKEMRRLKSSGGAANSSATGR
jgi:hypothetical protein